MTEPASSPSGPSLAPPERVRPIIRVMRVLSRMMPSDPSGENARAVKMFARMNAMKDLANGMAVRRALGRLRKDKPWPVTSGAYAVSDPHGAVAVCTLTSDELFPLTAQIPGVAIAGRVIVPNLGIEKIIQNVTANPNIRFLLLCGKESQVFHPGQALLQLFSEGVDENKRILGARGHLPVLKNLEGSLIGRFLKQIELVDLTGEMDLEVIRKKAEELVSRSPGRFEGPSLSTSKVADVDASFEKLALAGKRSRIEYDRLGFFVVSLDRDAGEIVLRHYHNDHRPGYEVRARNADSALRPAIAKGIVSQLEHAAYLGAELAKAEAALKLGLVYEQDKPLRKA